MQGFLNFAEQIAKEVTGREDIVAGFKDNVCLIAFLDGTIIGHAWEDKDDWTIQYVHISKKYQ